MEFLCATARRDVAIGKFTCPCHMLFVPCSAVALQGLQTPVLGRLSFGAVVLALVVAPARRVAEMREALTAV